MKTLHFASIFVLAAATTFACDDSEDRVPTGTAGSSGAAGKNGSAGNASAGKNNGNAGTATAGSTTDTDVGGAGAGASHDGGMGGGGAAGENQGGGEAGAGGGEAGAGGNGGTGGDEGGAGGDGGAGGAPDVPDVVVAGPTELIGTWDTNFGGTEVITANTWSGANMVAYSSGVTVVYTHNPANAPYNAKKFSKYVYTQPVSDSFYFCQIVYNAATLEAAQADTKVADATTPATSGCSGFSWTKATKH